MASQQAIDRAEQMGARSGSAWRDFAIPTRNPFTGAAVEPLAAAWRRGYFAALAESGGAKTS